MTEKKPSPYKRKDAMGHVIDSVEYCLGEGTSCDSFDELFNFWVGHVRVYHYQLTDLDVKEVSDMMWKVERGEIKP